jgi:hypothetical protein
MKRISMPCGITCATPRPSPPSPRRDEVTLPPPAPAITKTAAASSPVGDAEDVVIERARIALARSQFDDALKLLSEHEQRFPNGPLRSERELLFVRALLGTSDRASAIERAQRLRRAHPDDPALPAIEAVLAR